jgi:hypothetical protein
MSLNFWFADGDSQQFDLIPDPGRISHLLFDHKVRYCLFFEKHVRLPALSYTFLLRLLLSIQSVGALLKQAGFAQLNNWLGVLVAVRSFHKSRISGFV